MENVKNIKLTEDPLTNIYMMIPLLNEEARKAISYLMYGCFLGSQLVEKVDGNTTGEKEAPEGQK